MASFLDKSKESYSKQLSQSTVDSLLKSCFIPTSVTLTEQNKTYKNVAELISDLETKFPVLITLKRNGELAQVLYDPQNKTYTFQAYGKERFN